MSDEETSFASNDICKEQVTLSGKHPVNGLNDINGCKVLNVGFLPTDEGGLTFEYEKEGKIRRMVLGYTDLGLWVKWLGDKT